MYDLYDVTKPETFDEVLSNTYGLATSVLIAVLPAPTSPTYIVNVVICSWSCWGGQVDSFCKEAVELMMVMIMVEM